MALTTGACLLLPGGAQATYPGANGKIFFGGFDGSAGTLDVWSINPDGTGLINLTDLPGGTGEGGNPSVSGDGSKVVYVTGTQGMAELWTMNADGSNPVRIEPTNDGELDEHPSISPDGTRITYFHEDRIPPPPDPPVSLDRNDWIMNADGTGQALLFDGLQEDYYPVFTPDGASVVVTAETLGGFDLLVVPSAGGPFSTGTNLTNTPAFQERKASVSPDGSRVAFDRYEAATPGQIDVYSVAIDGTDLQPIAANPTLRESSPALSPDGAKIVYGVDGVPTIAAATGANPAPLAVAPATFPTDFDWAPAQPVVPISEPRPSPSPDTTAPGTRFKRKPKNEIDMAKATYKFTSTEPGSTFACKFDKGHFKSCSSPRKLKRLDEGRHRFLVRAIDAAGNADLTPAKDRFAVADD